MSKHILKRKALQDLSNSPSKQTKAASDTPTCYASEFLPVLENVKSADTEPNASLKITRLSKCPSFLRMVQI